MKDTENKPIVVFEDLGLIDYQQAWDYQTECHNQLVQAKRPLPNAVVLDEKPRHHFIICEHPPVFTLGKSGKESHLLLNEEDRSEQGFQYYKINRGGDITYHGPGQIVGYPILDLEDFYCDVHRYVREIEEVIIRVLGDFGLEGIRYSGYTGVWLPEDEKRPFRKICAIGVHLSRWVSLHGFAFNITTDLSHFNHIIPCGIKEANMTVTSLEQEIGQLPDMDFVKERLMFHFGVVFNCQLVGN